MLQPRKFLIVIAGPTAVGKTGVAVDVARHFTAPVLSADSRQFYKGIEIGTAQPAKEQLSAVPHFFIANKQVGELYGAGHYERDVLKTLQEVYSKHNVAVLCGGSGLYIRAVLEGVDELPEAPEAVRSEISRRYTEKGLDWLQSEVKKADPEYFSRADTSNPQRLMRALEVSLATGKKFSSFRKRQTAPRPFTPVCVLLDLPREELYGRINKRVDDMMAAGLVEEARRMLPHRGFNALKTVGYRELFDYFDGKYDLETAISKIKQHTRNYAKRQLTWFRNQGNFVSMPPDAARVIAYCDRVMKLTGK